jgi:hypothetical protein
VKNIKINLFLKDQILVENVITCFGHVVEYSFEVIENNTSFVFTCSFVSQKGWMFCSIDHLTIMLHFDVAISNRSLGSTMSNIKTYYSLFFGCINIISSYFHLDLRALHICVSHWTKYNNINDFNWFFVLSFHNSKTSSLLCIITFHSPRCVKIYHKYIVSNLNCKFESQTKLKKFEMSCMNFYLDLDFLM